MVSVQTEREAMIEILTGDFRELSKNIESDSIDLVCTDPPYPREFLPLWADLGRVAARVLKPSGFLVSYSGNMFLPEVMGMLGEHLSYYWLGGLYHRGPKSRIWARNILQAMKPILVYQKPPYKIQSYRFIDLVESPKQDKRHHKWGQPVIPTRRLVEAFSNESDLIFDPFLGGGTTAVACRQTGRNCIAHEIDPEVAERARKRVATCQMPLIKPETIQYDFETMDTPRCKSCSAILETNGGPGRKKEYCDDACRQAAYRNRKQRNVTKLRPSATGASV